MNEAMSRRTWIERTLLFAGGITTATAANWAVRFGAPHILQVRVGQAPVTAGVPAAPSAALSLHTLQQKAQAMASRGKALPKELAELDGLNRIQGFTLDGVDLILFGARDAAAPPIHIDDLLAAFKSAYQVEGPYREDAAPGVSIDPGPNPEDRFSIQQARIIGVEVCRMSKRFLDLDYELKLASVGIARIPGVRSHFDGDQRPICGGQISAASDVLSRYWFTARYPEGGARFEASANTVRILRPVGVQVLTERSMLKDGRLEKAGPPDPSAEAFAQEVTRAFEPEETARPEYKALRNDFRLIEMARAVKARGMSADLDYLLREHRPEPVSIPRWVSGIQRVDTTEVTCAGTVRETERELTRSADVRHLSSSYRGGVDAGVDTPAEQFLKQPETAFDPLVRRIRTSRPSPDSWIWSIEA